MFSGHVFHGITHTGQAVQGTAPTRTKAELIAYLNQQHITLRYAYPRIDLFNRNKRYCQLNKRHQFTQQLLQSLQQSMPIDVALQLIKDQEPHPHLQQQYQSIITAVSAGLSLSQALSETTLFDNQYCQFIRIGEQHHSLTTVLTHLADYIQHQQQTRRAIKKALLYPCCVLIISIAITLALLIWVVPQFSEIFANMNKPLPALTQSLINASRYLQQHTAALAISTTLLCTGIYHFRHHHSLKKIKLALLQHTPLLRSHYHHAQLTHITTLLHIALNTGLPLANALNDCHQPLPPSPLRTALQQCLHSLSQGASFSHALHQTAYFPQSFARTIAVAEKNGTLANTLGLLSSQLRLTLHSNMEKITTLFEPLTILILSTVIGSIVTAMYLPLFQLGNTL